MDQESDEEYSLFYSVPDEVVSMILANNDCRDIINFGSTCKRYNELVNSDQHLWRDKFKSSMPKVIYDIVEQHSDGDWLREVKHFNTLKRVIISDLLSMSAQYFWRLTDVSLEDVRNFFGIALSSNISYYYTMIVLQDLLRTGVKFVDEGRCEKPYTLTEMHYAKVALRHLIQTFLAVKWVKGHVKSEHTPEVVLNFFLQWIDSDNFHSDEEVQSKINDEIRKVEAVLEASTPKSKESVKERCAKGQISERMILGAVTQVLYQQKHMAVTDGSNLDTLNIVKVLQNRCGSIISVAVIYQAIARHFGVTCELVAFPNHLFLEWRDNSEYRSPKLHTVDFATGELHPKRQCPFSERTNSNYSYSPDAFLQYIYASYHLTMGAIKNWNTQNAIHLLDFLGIYDSDRNPYRYFLPFLLDRTVLPAMTTTYDIKYLSDDQLRLLSSLANLNLAHRTSDRKAVVKRHDRKVKFAVGMICYHRKYDYVCIIRGWDVSCQADMEWQRRGTLDFGPTQPFYNVIAADQSERYVAQGGYHLRLARDMSSRYRVAAEAPLSFGPKQNFYNVIAADQSERYIVEENLTEVAHPTRLYHLEDLIGREFTHFDGFAYVPNDQKRYEYPDEDPIIDVYRIKCQLRPGLVARAHQL